MFRNTMPVSEAVALFDAGAGQVSVQSAWPSHNYHTYQ